MYSRHITVQIKKTWMSEIPEVFEKEVLPLLRRQKGFLDEMLFFTPEKAEIVAISLWENKEFAEIYNREFYPEVVRILNKYVEGSPGGEIVLKFNGMRNCFPACRISPQ